MRYKECFRKRVKMLFMISFLVALSTGLSCLSPYLYGKVIDSITEKKAEELKIHIVFLGIVFLLMSIAKVIESFGSKITIQAIINDIKKVIFKCIVQFKASSLDKYASGELLSRIQTDADEIVNYYINLYTSIIVIVFNICVSVWFVIKISKVLSVVSAFFLPSAYMLNYIMKGKLKNIQIIQKKYNDQYFKQLDEILYNIRNYKVFCLEKSIIKSFTNLLEKNFDIVKKNAFLSNVLIIIQGIIDNIFELLILFLSGILILKGEMSIGSMVAFNTYLSKLFDAVTQILAININKQSLQVSVDRLNELHCEGKEQVEIGEKIKDDIFLKNIIFKKVSFMYQKKYVLSDFNIELKGPGLYSIIGANGSGKTTALRMLVRLYENNKGVILLNDVDIKEYSINSLREKIAYMTKEFFIVDDTIRNNILLGNDNKLESKLEEVCSIVGLKEYIEQLEDKYDTIIGEQGKFLSSGQKQRICLARILIKNAHIILLDEATSDLDGMAEKEILEVVQKLGETKLIISVSHKESFLYKSKKIFLIHKGKVIEEGTYESLSQNSEIYSKFFRVDEMR